jgi:hypothetical protein
MTNDDDKPKPYIDVAGLIWDGSGNTSNADMLEMIKLGYYMHAWGEFEIYHLDMSEHIENCKCQPIWEKDGVRFEHLGNGAERVDVRCDWCQNEARETK